ncbi:MAG: alanine racemase, partial [Gammaproteobacteria bacterium]
MTYPTLTIDLGAIVANWHSLAARHPGETAGVVKANAYGLGIEMVAPALAAAGCKHFFVATMEEAVRLRGLLPGHWIAVLNGSPPGSEHDMITHRLIPALNSLEACERWRDAIRNHATPPPALLHVDTGMSRLGLDADEYVAVMADPSRIDGLGLTHIMTHLVAAEAPEASENVQQKTRFAAIAAAFPRLRTSLANSSGLFLGPDFVSGLARPGYALYGGNPTPHTLNPMRPAIHLAAPVLQVRTIAPGESVGYNGTWRAERPSRIATIGVGYADGIPRSLSGRMTARFGGAVIRMAGRISMDLMTFDVTEHPAIVPGAML